MITILTKQYQIVHDGKLVLSFVQEQGKITKVGIGRKYFETDNKREAEKYIKDNNLEYTEI